MIESGKLSELKNFYDYKEIINDNNVINIFDKYIEIQPLINDPEIWAGYLILSNKRIPIIGLGELTSDGIYYIKTS